MRHCVSEARAIYEDYNHGQFSKALAEWAISMMETKDAAGRKVRLLPTSVEDVMAALGKAGVKVMESQEYTAWYLYNMARADYPKALPTDVVRAHFVNETINDPDCRPEAVLECFVAKMCCMGVPIHWEKFV